MTRATSSIDRKAATITYGFWLTFDDKGGVRFTRNSPTTYRKERAMSCVAVLPLSLFRTASLSATIKVNADGAADMAINVEAAGEALRTALGVDVDLQVLYSEAAP